VSTRLDRLEKAAAKLAPQPSPDRGRLTAAERSHYAQLLGRERVPERLSEFTFDDLEGLLAAWGRGTPDLGP
jgi:hypothetical protein